MRSQGGTWRRYDTRLYERAETIGVVANTLTLLSFLYVVTCSQRIRKKFGRTRLTYMRQPIFLLICHLSICDLLYCLEGLPTYW